MAIPTLQIPGYQGQRDLDFSSLAQLPAIYKQGQQEAARREAMSLANLGQGGEGFGKAINSLAAGGDLEGAAKLAAIQKAVAPETSADMQAYNLYRKQGGTAPFLEFKKELAQAGATRINNTVNTGYEKEFDKEIGREFGKSFVETQKTGRNAGSAMNTLDFMENLTKNPNFYSGAGGDLVTKGKQVLSAAGVSAPDAASANELFRALGNKLTLDASGGSLGAQISNSDREFLQSINPNLATTPEGNRELIGYQRKVYQRQQQVARMAREYASKNGGRIDAGFEDVVREFAEKNPLFKRTGGPRRTKSGISYEIE